jgi:RNA-splicing ligase RtcB
MITGKTILDLGFRAGKWFKEAIEYANTHHLVGEELVRYLQQVCPPLPLEPFTEPLTYLQNIIAETPEETENVRQVRDTMSVLMKTPTILNACIMPDACPTGEVGQIPVGAIVVTKNAIHPAMHSADICCSVMMTSLGFVAPQKVLDKAFAITHFGKGGRQDCFTLPENLQEEIHNNPYLNSEKSRQLARTQLGTQGDGNHFLFVGKSKNTQETVIVTHHGSRGFGAQLYKEGVKIAEKFRRELSPKTLPKNAWIPYLTYEGDTYWKALQIVRKWTKLNHQVLHQRIYEELHIFPTLNFWNEHNFVFKENDLFYHAKGATPLDDKFLPDSFQGLRLIPLNMTEPVLVVKGQTTPQNLGFAPHGAGRNISRNQHAKSKASQTLEEILQTETHGLDSRFFSGKADISELPSAYKNAESVKNQMQLFGLGEVVDEIMPYGCIMAGKIDMA